MAEEGDVSTEENRALVQAIQAYQLGGDTENLQPFESFLAAYPQSRWRVSVLANVGSWYRKRGYYTRAIDTPLCQD